MFFRGEREACELDGERRTATTKTPAGRVGSAAVASSARSLRPRGRAGCGGARDAMLHARGPARAAPPRRGEEEDTRGEAKPSCLLLLLLPSLKPPTSSCSASAPARHRAPCRRCSRVAGNRERTGLRGLTHAMRQGGADDGAKTRGERGRGSLCCFLSCSVPPFRRPLRGAASLARGHADPHHRPPAAAASARAPSRGPRGFGEESLALAARSLSLSPLCSCFSLAPVFLFRSLCARRR